MGTLCFDASYTLAGAAAATATDNAATATAATTTADTADISHDGPATTSGARRV